MLTISMTLHCQARQIVVDDIKTIISKSEALGLELNTAKCEVTNGDSSTPHDDPISKTFQRTEIDDLKLLGAPILLGRTVDKALKENNREVGEGYVKTPLAAVSRCSQYAPKQHQRSKATLHASNIRVQRQSSTSEVCQAAVEMHHRRHQHQHE